MADVLRGRFQLWADLADRLGLASAREMGLRLPNRLAVFSHHKCGTVWLSNYLTEFCQMNGLTYIAQHESHLVPSKTHDVSFLANSMYHKIRGNFDGKALHVIRNPMSILVSAYHSHLTSHPTEGTGGLVAWRKALQAMSLEQGFEKTLVLLEQVRDDDYHGPLTVLKNWNYDDPDIITLRMEDLTLRTGELFSDVLARNGVKRYKLPNDKRFAFENVTRGRKVGEVDNTSHYRSGDPNGWRNELDPQMQDRMRKTYEVFLTRFYPETLS